MTLWQKSTKRGGKLQWVQFPVLVSRPNISVWASCCHWAWTETQWGKHASVCCWFVDEVRQFPSFWMAVRSLRLLFILMASSLGLARLLRGSQSQYFNSSVATFKEIAVLLLTQDRPTEHTTGLNPIISRIQNDKIRRRAWHILPWFTRDRPSSCTSVRTTTKPLGIKITWQRIRPLLLWTCIQWRKDTIIWFSFELKSTCHSSRFHDFAVSGTSQWSHEPWWFGLPAGLFHLCGCRDPFSATVPRRLKVDKYDVSWNASGVWVEWLKVNFGHCHRHLHGGSSRGAPKQAS